MWGQVGPHSAVLVSYVHDWEKLLQRSCACQDLCGLRGPQSGRCPRAGLLDERTEVIPEPEDSDVPVGMCVPALSTRRPAMTQAPGLP